MRIPSPTGKQYLPYQVEGIEQIAARKNNLLADEMGLGKTIQAIGLINMMQPYLDACYKPLRPQILIVCPAYLKINWFLELRDWLAEPSMFSFVGLDNPQARIIITNYAAIHKQRGYFDIDWELIIADECHYGKNPESNRAKLLWALHGKRKLAMTGTPILNRPIEIQRVLTWLDPEAWNLPRHDFGKMYCQAKWTEWGWEYKGACNLDALQQKLKDTVMVRRLKADVLTELPDKIRRVIQLDVGPVPLAKMLKQKLFGQKNLNLMSEFELDAAMQKLGSTEIDFDELSKVRVQLGLAKIQPAIKHIENCLRQTDKIVVFTWHRQVAIEIAQHFKTKPILGDTPMQVRSQMVQDFQGTDMTNMIVGTIGSMGAGITLTRAQHAVAVECDMVPGNMLQAEDRLHRITQTLPVTIDYLMVENSIDSIIGQMMVHKLDVIRQALDRPSISPALKELIS